MPIRINSQVILCRQCELSPPPPLSVKGGIASALVIRFIKPLPLLRRDFSTQGHIPFHIIYFFMHEYDRAKELFRLEALIS